MEDEPPRLLTRTRIHDVKGWFTSTEAEGNTHYLEIDHTTGGRPHEGRIRLRDLAKRSERLDALHRAGMSVGSEGAGDKLGAALMQWWEQISNAGELTLSETRQGWVETTKRKERFVLGDKIYHASGKEHESFVTDSLVAETMIQQGSIEQWRTAAEVILKDNPILACMIAASFGAPLVSLHNTGAATFSFWSQESGVGKSAALRVAAAIWGGDKFCNNTDDTANGAVAKLAMMPNLPMLWDEVRTSNARKDVIELLFRLPTGQSKLRSDVRGNALTPVTFSTMGVVTSNEPLTGSLLSAAVTAQGMRLLEMRVPPLTEEDVATGRNLQALRDVGGNHGAAGAMYVKYVLAHQPEVKAMLHKVEEALEARVEASAGERLLIGAATVAFVGAALATKAGIVTFNLTSLFETLVTAIKDHCEAIDLVVEESTAKSLLMEFLSEEPGVIYDKFRGRGRVGSTLNPPMVKRAPMDGKAVYAVARDTGECRVYASAFRRWAKYKDPAFNVKSWRAHAELEGLLAPIGTGGEGWTNMVSLDNGGLVDLTLPKVRGFVAIIPELAKGGHLTDVSQPSS
jgi:hypothetical protein